MQVEILPVPLNDPHLESLSDSQILLWSEGKLTQVQRQRLLIWVEQGLSIILLGSTARLLGAEEPDSAEAGEDITEEDPHTLLHIVSDRHERKK